MVISCALPNTRFIRASPSLYPLRTVQIAHRAPLCLATRLRLEPFGGDGDTSHIQDGIEVSPPPALDLKEGIFEVGRVDTADLIVPLPTVSARHCALQIEGGAVAVMDLGSTNGTFIDNIELKANKPVRSLSYIRTVVIVSLFDNLIPEKDIHYQSSCSLLNFVFVLSLICRLG